MGEMAMNREQKRAWSILIGMSAAMLLSLTGFLIGGFKTYPSKAFLILAGAALGGGVLISFRLKPDPGAVTFDERDRIIAQNAGVYRFIKEYPFSGISGWRWFVYRHEK